MTEAKMKTVCKRAWVASAFDVSHDGRGPLGKTRRGSASADHRLWADKHRPQAKMALAVHKKKVTEVEEALLNACYRRNKASPLLLLTGPSGAGKTATVCLLTKIHGLEVKEWVNPLSQEANMTNSLSEFRDEKLKQSQGQRFWEFLMRANRYPSLEVCDEKQIQKIVLVEDIPNAFFGNPSEFQSMIRTHCHLNRCCIVFILNEDNKSVAIKELFPDRIKQELAIQHIRFNPVAATSMMKLLSRVATAELSLLPSKGELDSIVLLASGDVRLALNTLQFTYGVTNKKVCERHTTSLIKRKVDNARNKDGCLQPARERDQTLFICYALGKILHCKRSEDRPTDANALPVQLQTQARHPALLDPETVVNNCAVSSESMMLFLHQNHLRFLSEIAVAAATTKHLSDAAVLGSQWEANDVLEECCSLVAVRGYMHAVASGSSLGWTPIRKPAWYLANKMAKERRCLVQSLQQDFKLMNQKLITEVLPFYYRIVKDQPNSPAYNLCQEVCSFLPVNRNNEDVGDLDDKRNGSVFANNKAASLLISANNAEDDFDIEDAD